MSDAVLKAADRMREFIERSDRGMARVPVAHISEWRKLLSERYQAEVERVNRATDAEIGGIHRSFAPSPAALPSPTSGAEAGGELFGEGQPDTATSLATQIMALPWKSRDQWTVEEQADWHGNLQNMIDAALAKLASEPAGGGGTRKPYDMIVKRLLNPPFGTETSERLLMGTAADAIRTLLDENAALSSPASSSPAADYVVWSNEHRAWWGPNRSGYCTALERAGRYDRDAALAICDGARGGRQYNDNPSEVPVLFADAERFWPNDKPEWAAARFQYRHKLRPEEL